METRIRSSCCLVFSFSDLRDKWLSRSDGGLWFDTDFALPLTGSAWAFPTMIGRKEKKIKSKNGDGFSCDLRFEYYRREISIEMAG